MPVVIRSSRSPSQSRMVPSGGLAPAMSVARANPDVPERHLLVISLQPERSRAVRPFAGISGSLRPDVDGVVDHPPVVADGEPPAQETELERFPLSHWLARVHGRRDAAVKRAAHVLTERLAEAVENLNLVLVTQVEA